MNSMLYLSENNQDALDKWSAKERFPMNSKLKEQLQCLSKGYKEIKSLIPDYFDTHEKHIKSSHKSFISKDLIHFRNLRF